MNRTRSLATAALLTAGAVAVATLLGPGAASSSPTDEGRVKAATARYHSIQQAVRDGYSGENEPCVSSPGGAMGFHYINTALIDDPAIDPLKPEILLYAPDKHGKLVLVGVEYLAVDADQNLATDGDRPSLFGQPFDGPMPGHGPGPVHYDLHAWIWSDNPSGEYAPFNPSLSCG